MKQVLLNDEEDTYNKLEVRVQRAHTQAPAVVLSRSRTGFRKPRICSFVMPVTQTGLLAGSPAVADLITFILLPRMNLHGMFAIPIDCIYTNVSVLSTASESAV